MPASRLIKLLETATHPSATPGERLNALDAFRRAADRAGGVTAVMNSSKDENHHGATQLRAALDALNIARSQINQLTKERDDALSQVRRNRESTSKPVGTPIGLIERSVVGALTTDWQTVHEISRQVNGHTSSISTSEIESALDSLTVKGLAVCQNAGEQRVSNGEVFWQPKTWRKLVQ